jgi:hypothetical protein
MREPMENINTQRNKPILQKISTFFVLYIAISSVFPPMHIIPGYTITLFIAMFSWGLCAIILKPAFLTLLSRNSIYRHFIIIFITYTVSISYLTGNFVVGNRYFSYSIVFFFYFVYQYNKFYGYEDSSKFIVKFSLPFILFTSIKTTAGLINNPNLSRSIKSTGEHSAAIQLQGIGGYSFIYFSVFFIIILLFLALNKKHLKFKKHQEFLIYSIVLLLTSTVILSNYFTALIMIFLSMTVIVLLRSTERIKKTFVVMVMGIIFLNGKSMFLIISGWFLKNTNGGWTMKRIELLRESVLNESFNNESLLTERSQVWFKSFELFKENPLFGAIAKNSGNLTKLVSQHSYVFDTFAAFGIFIGLINIYLVSQPFLIRIIKRDHLLLSLNMAITVSVLILLTVNILTPSIGFVIFFIYPVTYEWVLSRIYHCKCSLNKEVNTIS